MLSFIKEFTEFLKVRKKYWLLPIIIILALFGVLIVLSQGSAVAPFIYTIFDEFINKVLNKRIKHYLKKKNIEVLTNKTN